MNKILLMLLFSVCLIATSSTAAAMTVEMNQTRQSSDSNFNGLVGHLKFTAGAEDAKNIKIFSNFGLQHSFSDNNFVLNSATKSVSFNVVVPKFFDPKTFNSNLIITFENKTIVHHSEPYEYYDPITNVTVNGTVEIDFEVYKPQQRVIPFTYIVREHRELETTSHVELDLDCDKSANFTLEFENIGNVLINLDISSVNDFMNFTQSVPVYPSELKKIPVEVNVDRCAPPGVHEEEIELKFGDSEDIPVNVTYNDDVYELEIVIANKRIVPVNITVHDKIKPDIFVKHSDSVELTKSIDFEVEIDDNINVSEFIVNILDPDGIQTSFNDTEFTYENISKLGEWTVQAIVWDSSDNKNSSTSRFTVSKRKIVEVRDDIVNLGRRKIGNYTSFIFASIFEPTPVSVKLIESEGGGHIYIDTAETGKREITINDTIELSLTGYIKVGVNRASPGEITGRITIDVDDTVELDNRVTDFAVNFVEFYVPESQYTLVAGKYPRTCNVTLTEEYETSKLTCMTEYPIDVDPESMQLLVSQRMLDEIDTNHENEIGDKNQELGSMGLVATILGFIIIIFIAYFVWDHYIRPRSLMLRG